MVLLLEMEALALLLQMEVRHPRMVVQVELLIRPLKSLNHHPSLLPLARPLALEHLGSQEELMVQEALQALQFQARYLYLAQILPLEEPLAMHRDLDQSLLPQALVQVVTRQEEQHLKVLFLSELTQESTLHHRVCPSILIQKRLWCYEVASHLLR